MTNLTSSKLRTTVSDAIIVSEEKKIIYDVLINSTDDQLRTAISSHIKSTTTIGGIKYHDAIGAFFLKISSVDDFRNIILTPILTYKEQLPGIAFTKYTNGSYRVKVKTETPGIKNSINENLKNKVIEINNSVVQYTSFTHKLLSVRDTHRNSNSHVSREFRKDSYLDVANLINVLKFVNDNHMYECRTALISFAKELLSSALDESGPSECLEVVPSIVIGINPVISDKLIVLSAFPFFPYEKNFMKVKNLITHHEKLYNYLTKNGFI